MTRRLSKSSILVLVLVGMAAFEASAWGPRAQRAVTATAIQVIRREALPSAFKTSDTNYEEDVLRGSVAGPTVLNQGKLRADDAENIAAVSNEIGLLREVRKYGFGSYFSYRMGVLASLVADLGLPFALNPAPAGQAIRERMESDIDAHLAQYTFTPGRDSRRYIVSVPEYMAGYRTFFKENRQMIADDYIRAKGYDGYLVEGAQALFGRAVEAVADAWYTVLRVEGEPSDVRPSAAMVTWYLVDEIKYLLEQKGNLYEATKVYNHFARVNPGLMDAFDQVGDQYYAFGTEEARGRAVREWRIVYDASTPERRQIARKLASHYIQVGQASLEGAAQPRAAEESLPNALNAFTQALQFDQTNELAASLINETRAAIAERKERRELNVNVIASAQQVMTQADRSRVDGDFGAAIGTYKKAIGLFELIDNEFPDQFSEANSSIKSINKSITDVINEVLDKADDTVDDGDRAVDEHRFEDAVGCYSRVANIVSVIPGDESTTHGKEREDTVKRAAKKMDDAKMAKVRWEELQRQKEAAAKAAAAAAAKQSK